jgi:hypothetical protein
VDFLLQQAGGFFVGEIFNFRQQRGEALLVLCVGLGAVRRSIRWLLSGR